MKPRVKKFIIILALLGAYRVNGQSNVGGPRFLDMEREFDLWASYHDFSKEKFDRNVNTRQLVLNWDSSSAPVTKNSLKDSLGGYSSDKAYLLLLLRYPTVHSNTMRKKPPGNSSGHFIIIPLSKIELIRNTNAAKATLMVFSDSAYVESFDWLSPTVFEVYGFKKTNKAKYVPTIWQYDLGKMTIRESECKRSSKARPKDYLGWKLR